jgi:hypothetical protein
MRNVTLHDNGSVFFGTIISILIGILLWFELFAKGESDFVKLGHGAHKGTLERSFY